MNYCIYTEKRLRHSQMLTLRTCDSYPFLIILLWDLSIYNCYCYFNCHCWAPFILPANANAIRILTSQDSIRSDCFAGLEHKSTDANFHVENLWHQNSLSIPRKFEPGFPCMGVQYTHQWQNKMCVPTAYVYMWYDSKLCMVIFYGLFNDANTLVINKLL